MPVVKAVTLRYAHDKSDVIPSAASAESRNLPPQRHNRPTASQHWPGRSWFNLVGLEHRISRRSIFAAALALPVSSLRDSHAALAQSTPAAADDYPGNTPNPLLIDIGWLADRLATLPDSTRVIDVSRRHVYRDRHIAGATHAWWRDTVDPNYPVFGAVLTQGEDQRFRREVVEDLGVDHQDHVVVYDDDRGFRAARMVWFLRFLGFRQVSLLDGGLSDWQVAGGQTDDGGQDPPDRDVPALAPQPGFYVVTSQLIDRLADPNLQLIDIRTDDERADDLDGQLPIGTIPGSMRYPWTNALGGDSTKLKPFSELQRSLSLNGIDPNRRTVIYGRFGVDTAHTWLVFKLLGFPMVETYDRGWVEWASSPDLEIEPLN